MSVGIILVGLGDFAHEHLGRALEESEYCRLVGVVSDNPDVRNTWKQKYHLDICLDYSEFPQLSEYSEVDVVHIVTPNATHLEWVEQAARAGKHVLVEKPMAPTVDECLRMIAACEKAGVRLFVSYRLHLEPHHQQARDFLRQGPPVAFLETGYARCLQSDETSRLDPTGGGPLLDIGIYAIQAARYLTGEEPLSVTAQSVKTDPARFPEIAETILWQLRFPSGAVASSFTGYSFERQICRVTAAGQWIEVREPFGYEGFSLSASTPVPSFPAANPIQLLYDEIAVSLRENTPVSFSGAEGLQDIRIIEAIQRALSSGQAEAIVTLPSTFHVEKNQAG